MSLEKCIFILAAVFSITTSTPQSLPHSRPSSKLGRQLTPITQRLHTVAIFKSRLDLMKMYAE